MEALYESQRDNHHHVEVFRTGGASPHFHAQIEILCVLKGSIDVTVNGVTALLTEGGICVLGSYDVHSYTVNETSDGAVLLFPLEHVRQFAVYTKDVALMRHILYDESVFKAIKALLEVYEQRKGRINALFEYGWANAVMGVLVDALEFAPAEVGGEAAKIREVLTYIHAHYDESLTLSSLSKHFGYSPCYFSRVFNRFTKIGLKKYINSVRMEYAVDKIKNGESIMSAAFNAGFNSMRSFYRDFAESYGMTPQQYAQQAKRRIVHKDTDDRVPQRKPFGLSQSE